MAAEMSASPQSKQWVTKKRAFFVLRTFAIVCVSSFLMVSFDNNLVKNLGATSSYSDSISRNLTISNRSHLVHAQTTTTTTTALAPTNDSFVLGPHEGALVKTAMELVERMKDIQAQELALKEEKKRLELVEKRKRLALTTPHHDYVAGCVMVMDSNHDLIEWLAYHYFTLPLRRLIILNDAKSKTTPEPIANRWKGLMDITIWDEEDVWPNGAPKTKKDDPEGNYIKRQFSFNKHCMTKLYEEGHRWVQIHDPDEYMTINEKVYKKNEKMYGLNASSATIDVPSHREAGSILKFVKSAIDYVQKFGTQNNRYLQTFETPCIPFHRKQYAAKDDTPKQRKDSNTEGTTRPVFPLSSREGLQAKDLHTWRWRQFGGKVGIIGKSLVDFDRLAKNEIPNEANVHLPINKKGICRDNLVWRGEAANPMVMNHYASTLAQALFRSSDSRHESRQERYDKDKELYGKFYEKGVEIFEWLPGFVGSFGKAEAARLLKGAGNPETANCGAYLTVTATAGKDSNTTRTNATITTNPVVVLSKNDDDDDDNYEEDTAPILVRGNTTTETESTRGEEEAKASNPLPTVEAASTGPAGDRQTALLTATMELAHQLQQLNAKEKNLMKEHQQLKADAAHSAQKEQVGQGSQEDYVSGCLMVMDSNHDLIEWLAYHYHTLPLRRLIIFNDLKARTVPGPILQRWNGLMNITVLNEKDIWPSGVRKNRGENDEFYYVRRQKEFNNHCMTTLYAEGHRWIQLHDPDEYMTINDRVYNKSDPMYFLGIEPQSRKSISVPSPIEAGSTLKFVKSVVDYVHKYGVQSNKYLQPFETPCLAFHRKQFSNWEDANKTKPIRQQFPFNESEGLSPSDLSTWRWRFWGGKGAQIMGKALIDFNRIEAKDIPKKPSVHVPIYNFDICRRDLAWRGEQGNPLVMNHYASSWEQAMFRTTDSRNGEQGRIDRFKKDQAYRKNYDESPRILSWLVGFVRDVGREHALQLLQSAGNPETANIGAFQVKDPMQNHTQTEIAGTSNPATATTTGTSEAREPTQKNPRTVALVRTRENTTSS